MISNVVQRYKSLLESSGIDFTNNKVLVDPSHQDFKDVDNVVVLQQGQAEWLKDQSLIDKVNYVITLSPIIKAEINDRVETIILPFPISDLFKKKTKWEDREEVLYYHGRLMPSKLATNELECILNHGIRVVVRGPICKMYWTDQDHLEKEFVSYKEEILRLDKQYSNLTLLPSTEDESILIEELNKYKFYFTLSTGEAFNVALQEAIACGTIPIVKSNEAYWWANHLMLQFNHINDLISKFDTCVNLLLEEYSDRIAEEIKRRCSFVSIKKTYDECYK